MATKGNCFICGKTVAKSAIKNHIQKYHNSGGQYCALFKAEGADDKNYWLYFSLALTATLREADIFLRGIWCECCDHLSEFNYEGKTLSKSRKIYTIPVGSEFTYEYDFGSTTEITLSLVEKVSRQKQKAPLQLIARNEPPPNGLCEKCGAPATRHELSIGTRLCDSCKVGNGDEDEYEDDFDSLPIVNSPRSGVCGYDGDSDRWTFIKEEIENTENA